MSSLTSAVHVIQAVLVTPAEPTPSTVLPLSALDSQLFLRFTIEYLLVYKPAPPPPCGSDRTGIAAIVKDALSRALVNYFPLAGRVRSRTDGLLGLEVACTAQGALFIEAAASDQTPVRSDEFEKAPKFCGQWRKLLSLHVADVLKGAPPVVVQLTWLSDGSATLAVALNHCLIDGVGSGEFLNSFADLATGKCGLGNGAVKPAMPVWDRHLMNPNLFLKQNSQAFNPLRHPEFNRVADLCGFASRFTQETLVPTQVTFNKRSIYELKKLAAPTTASWPSEFSSTSFEVLAAHVWKSWVTALKLPSNQIIKLLFSVNVRDRVKPSLPSGYYGNAFVLGCAQTCVRDMTEKGLEYATELVKTAKERVDDEYVREVIEAVSSSARVSPDSVGVLIVTQWSRLGIERVNFGLGEPVHVGPLCTDKYCIFSPVHNKRTAIKVNLAVPASAVDRYLCLLRSG